jgi:hypothetical protein
VAKEWHMSPSQFEALSIEDKAKMIATERTLAKMRNWENYLADRKRKKQ